MQANPSVAGRLAQLRQQNRNYLAHEYFNRDWLPMPFSDVAFRPFIVIHEYNIHYAERG